MKEGDFGEYIKKIAKKHKKFNLKKEIDLNFLSSMIPVLYKLKYEKISYIELYNLIEYYKEK